jgi:glycosyltransferase involved in cell wall biosynthesis
MESFGMVLTRAFACAVPVVSSDIAGYRDVMTDETGLLVPPGEPAALAEAVVTLLEDEELRRRLGAAARVVAVERYSWSSIAERLSDVYRLVVELARRAAVTA